MEVLWVRRHTEIECVVVEVVVGAGEGRNDIAFIFLAYVNWERETGGLLEYF